MVLGAAFFKCSASRPDRGHVEPSRLAANQKTNRTPGASSITKAGKDGWEHDVASRQAWYIHQCFPQSMRLTCMPRRFQQCQREAALQTSRAVAAQPHSAIGAAALPSAQLREGHLAGGQSGIPRQLAVWSTAEPQPLHANQPLVSVLSTNKRSGRNSCIFAARSHLLVRTVCVSEPHHVFLNVSMHPLTFNKFPLRLRRNSPLWHHA